MSITAIRAALQTELAGVVGVTTAFYPAPQQAPIVDFLPCFIIEKQKPFLVTNDEALGFERYTWNFLIKFLFTREGTSTYDQWMLNIEPFYKRTVDVIKANITLGATATSQDSAMSFSEGMVDYLGTQYYGFELAIKFWEKINTVMG